MLAQSSGRQWYSSPNWNWAWTRPTEKIYAGLLVLAIEEDTDEGFQDHFCHTTHSDKQVRQ